MIKKMAEYLNSHFSKNILIANREMKSGRLAADLLCALVTPPFFQRHVGPKTQFGEESGRPT